jgi:lauroyl/myristoyl acyltransferase
MSIGSFLLNKENLELVQKNSWKFGRALILEKGLRYYSDNPAEVALIERNLAMMGFAVDAKLRDETLREMVVHYYEKLFALVKSYEAVWICRNRVDVGDSLRHYEEARQDGKAVFIAQSHFGATYLMASVLMVHGYSLTAVGNFPEPAGSMLIANSEAMATRYALGTTRFLNLADASVDVPMEMMRLLLTKQIVSNVFDENNQFCRPVTLLGKQLFGGTGMDLILKNFKDDRVVLVTPFLIRTGDDSFRYEVDRHYAADGDIIDSFYRSLEKRIRANPAQWYFIHEVHESFIDKRLHGGT